MGLISRVSSRTYRRNPLISTPDYKLFSTTSSLTMADAAPPKLSKNEQKRLAKQAKKEAEKAEKMKKKEAEAAEKAKQSGGKAEAVKLMDEGAMSGAQYRQFRI